MIYVIWKTAQFLRLPRRQTGKQETFRFSEANLRLKQTKKTKLQNHSTIGLSSSFLKMALWKLCATLCNHVKIRENLREKKT